MLAIDDEVDWIRYLARLGHPMGCLTQEHAGIVAHIWERLRDLVPTIPIPMGGPSDDGSFNLVWDCGRHHFELSIWETALVEWFYSDRDKSFTGGEFQYDAR